MNVDKKFYKVLRVIAVTTVFFIFTANISYAQQEEQHQDALQTRSIPEVDIFDAFRKIIGKPAKVVDMPKAGDRNISFLPVVGYSPSNGMVFGGAFSATKYFGTPQTTQLTTVLLNASVTTKEQVILSLRFDLYTNNNKWYISGDNRMLFFTQPTYGLGIYGLQDQPYAFNWNGISGTTKGDLSQPLKYNYLRLYETFLRRVGESHWYAGLGIMIDYNFKIRDESLRLDSAVHLTSHYVYSQTYGFNTDHYGSNGLSAQIIHDTRDNPVSPYKGSYLNVGYRINPAFLGSSQNSNVLYYEYRTYISLSKKTPRNIIAFWLLGTSVVSGQLPYLELPSITWDTYNRSGRGYIQGRFRGNNMIYSESEFRFRITKNGLLGGVAFANFTTASNPLPYAEQHLFASVAPGGGIGLRIKMNKNDRTSITADYGFGYGFSGIYLNIREAF